MTPAREAAIAIGSNSVRMLCANLDSGLTAPVRGREETGLFLSMGEDRLFQDAAMAGLVEAIERLYSQARRAGADRISLIATSAVRDAGNAEALGRMIAAALPGLHMQVIPGGEEARLAFTGALLPPRPGPMGVVDIGGGSTEVALGLAGQGPGVTLSLQLGAARLLKLQAINSREDIAPARAAAAQVIQSRCPEGMGEGRPFALLGGTGTAALAVLRGIPFGQPLPEDGAVSLEEAEGLLGRLAGLDPAGRAALTGMPPTRLHILPTGLLILCELMRWLHIARIHVSQRNNLDGYLYQRYLEVRRAPVD